MNTITTTPNTRDGVSPKTQIDQEKVPSTPRVGTGRSMTITNQRQEKSYQTAALPIVAGPSGGSARSPFLKSSMMGRTPPKTPLEETLQQGDNCTPTDSSLQAKQTSPKRSFIAKMRKDEEDMLLKCKELIQKMKAATLKQKNISNDVKYGLADLEEAVDVITHCRTSWKTAEEQIQKETTTQASEPSKRYGLDTQTPSGSTKRIASSPAENEKEKDKRQKEDNPEEWQVQLSKRKEKMNKKLETTVASEAANSVPENHASKAKPTRKRQRSRNEALLIRPKSNQSYADVLKEIRTKAKPEEADTVIKAIRQTRQGHVLLELGTQTKNKAGFCEMLKGILGDRAEVVGLEPNTLVEIRDLDCYTDKTEVEVALKRDIPEIGDFKLNLFSSSRQQQIAVITMSEKSAAKLLACGKIKVGWVSCRVRKRATATRCFKCFGYGHVARNCEGPDRSSLCYKCLDPSHKAKACTAQEHCILCSERNLAQEALSHAPGSGKCRVYREALLVAKKRL